MKDETVAVVAGRRPALHYGVVNTPVYRTSTILFRTFAEFEAAETDPGNMRFAYGRLGTPASAALEEAIAALEGGTHCRLAPSGLAAITAAILAFVSAGDQILMTQGAYPPARRFAESMLARLGVETTFYDPLNRRRHRGADPSEHQDRLRRISFERTVRGAGHPRHRARGACARRSRDDGQHVGVAALLQAVRARG